MTYAGKILTTSKGNVLKYTFGWMIHGFAVHPSGNSETKIKFITVGESEADAEKKNSVNIEAEINACERAEY